jgi:hypothetical protein
MSAAGFEPLIRPSDQSQTHALHRADTGMVDFDSENLKAILSLKSTNPI